MDMKKRIHLELRNRTPSDVSVFHFHKSFFFELQMLLVLEYSFFAYVLCECFLSLYGLLSLLLCLFKTLSLVCVCALGNPHGFALLLQNITRCTI